MRLKTGVIVVCMLLALAASQLLQPKPLYDKASWPQGRLETMIPTTFGAWRVDPSSGATIISPDQKLWLTKLYSDTLSRTYVNDQGERIMLSIAYGADQGRSMQLHKPEVCYEAQGFKLGHWQRSILHTPHLDIPIVHLTATQATRIEPITYWIRSGDLFVRSALEQQWARLKSGLLSGHVPDGILVRVSSLDPDLNSAFDKQDAFMKDMLAASLTSARQLLVGSQPALP